MRHESLHEEEFLTTPNGPSLFTQRWLTQQNVRGTVVIVHGLAEHSRRYYHVAEHLNAHGLHTYTFDLRGHGRSEGPRVYVRSFDEFLDDIDFYLDFVRSHHAFQGPLFLLGHSMGGGLCTLYTIRHQPSLRGLILSAPAIKTGDDFPPIAVKAAQFLGHYLPWIPIQKLRSSSVSRAPGIVANYHADPFVYRGVVRAGFGNAGIQALQEIDQRMEEVTLPLLLLQGSADSLVDPDGACELYGRAHSNDKEIKFYEGLYHEVLNEPEREQVLQDLTQWILKRLI